MAYHKTRQKPDGTLEVVMNPEYLTYIIKYNDTIYSYLKEIFGYNLNMFMADSFEYIEDLVYGRDPWYPMLDVCEKKVGEGIRVVDVCEFVYIAKLSTGIIKTILKEEVSEKVRIAVPQYIIDLFDDLEITGMRSDLVFTGYYNKEDI